MNRRVLRLGTLAAVLVLAGTVGGVAALSALAAQEVDAEAGIVIVGVEPDGPAAESGVVRGDILQEINGETVDDMEDLFAALSELEPGDEVELTVLHGDDLRTLSATLGERNGDPYLGITPACGMHSDVVAFSTWPAVPEGALITEVLPDSPAEAAGLREGDVITAVDGAEVTSGGDLAEIVSGREPGDEITLQIRRDDEEGLDLKAELGANPDDEDAAFLGVRYLPGPSAGVWRAMGMPFGEMHHSEGLEDFDLEEMPEFHMEMVPDFHGFHDFDGFDEFEFDTLGEGFTAGSILLSVTKESPAWEAGLRKGDVITAIEGEPLDNPQALAEAVAEREPGDEIGLTVSSEDADQEVDVQVTLGEHPDDSERAYLGVVVGGFFMRGHLEGAPLGDLERFGCPFGEHRTQRCDRFEKRPFGFRWRNLPFDLDILPEGFRLPWSPSEEADGDGVNSVLQEA